MTPYSRDFFNLQIQFAQTILCFSEESAFDVLVDTTILRSLLHLYVVPKGEAEPLWHELVQRVENNDDPEQWVYDLYQSRLEIVFAQEQKRTVTAFGCFSFAYPFGQAPAVRLHFHNRPDLAEFGLLNDHNFERRLSELREMFAFIQKEHPAAQTVVGGSWMYHLEAYRRLFPVPFLESAKSGGYETGFWSLWGQFVKGNGDVRRSVADQFLENLSKQSSLAGCVSSFPFDVLRLDYPIDVFYDFYGLDGQ